jgi:hypothetical protein
MTGFRLRLCSRASGDQFPALDLIKFNSYNGIKHIGELPSLKEGRVAVVESGEEDGTETAILLCFGVQGAFAIAKTLH